jgi:2-dehydro-3-deoxygluconokinase
LTRIVCIGECMVELRASGVDTFARSYAGDVYNTAVYLKRSLPDAQVQFLTAVGDDAMSQAMRRNWQAQGIDDALAFPVAGGSAGLYLIETDARGERSFQYWRKDSAATRWLAQLQEHGESLLWGADLVYYSGITLAILNPDDRAAALEMLARLRPNVGRIAFDPNVRPRLWQSAQVAAQTLLAAIAASDIALPSIEDLSWILGASEPEPQLDRLLAMGASEVALTLGAHGCAIAAGLLRVQLRGPRIECAVDTSGAGDAFNGVYLANRLKGNAAVQAAEAALRVASRVATSAGAIVPRHVSHPESS